jgi:hypothetical protein
MNRKERVKAVYDFIDQYGDNEKNFSELYSKLLQEFNLEMEFNPDMRTNHYLNNLRQTRDKQASTYIHYKQKRPVKGAPSDFNDFVSNFRQDTTWAAV